MKRTVLICAITLLFAAGASAQVPSPISVYIGGALSVPSSGNFNAGWQMGYHGMAGVGYKLSKNLMVSGKIEHHTFFFDLADFFGVDGGDTKVWMYGIDGRYTLNLPAIPLKPYVKAGSGIAKISWQEFESTDPSTSIVPSTMPPGTEAPTSAGPRLPDWNGTCSMPYRRLERTLLRIVGVACSETRMPCSYNN